MIYFINFIQKTPLRILFINNILSIYFGPVVTLEETKLIVNNLEENLSNAQFRQLAENLNVISRTCGIEKFSIILEESGEMTLTSLSEPTWSSTSHREVVRHFLLNVWMHHSDANIDKLIRACVTTQLNSVASKNSILKSNKF